MQQKLIRTILILISLLLLAISADAAKVKDFIPKEAVVYLQLQDIDDVYMTLNMSENWQSVQARLTKIAPEAQQGLTTALTLFGTDFPTLIGTLGYRTGIAVWKGEQDEHRAGCVVHSGGNIAELRRLIKTLTGILGMNAGTLNPDAGEYLKVKYSTLQIPQALITYGFVDEFLVLSIGNGSFEKLIDTFRKKTPSIDKNREFVKASKELESGQATAFVNVQQALPLIKELSEVQRAQFAIFHTFFARLNLLETGTLLQVAAQFLQNSQENPELSENRIGLFLKEGAPLKTLNALSNNTELFIAGAPAFIEAIWQIVRSDIEKNATEETYAVITFFEGLLNLNFEEDVIAALTGEVALSASDLTQFNPDALEKLNVNFDNGAFEIDARQVETQFCLVFNPSHPVKLNEVGNSIANLQNASLTQSDYRGTKVSEFGENIYYGKTAGMFLLGLSEEEIHAVVDASLEKQQPAHLKQLPKSPIAFAQLNLARLLEVNGGTPPAELRIVDSTEITPMLAWVSINDETALLEIILSDKEAPVEAFAKLAPFVMWRLTRD